MKQLALVLFIALITSCSHRSTATRIVAQDSSYMLFELDFGAHTTATAWVHSVYVDSVHVEGSKTVHMVDTFRFAMWPVTVMDSANKKPRLNHEGKDSLVQGWVALKNNAILQDYGLPARYHSK